MNDIILVSGGFDPIHSGHIALIKEAAELGDVVVLLNSDNWLKDKKGKEFLSFNERKIIMLAIKNIIDVIPFDDSDSTCLDGIKKALQKYPNQKMKFANGGDRNDKTTPNQETIFCNANNVEVLWGIGGNIKANSSSKILERWKKLS